jgi:hypothetical protein
MNVEFSLITGAVAVCALLMFAIGVTSVRLARLHPRGSQAIGVITMWVGVACICASIWCAAAVLLPVF